jgi:hypothetical protein
MKIIVAIVALGFVPPALAGPVAPQCPLDKLLAAGKCPQGAAAAAAGAADALLLQSLIANRKSNFVGASQSLPVDAVNEAVQILGQIVVDRASAEGFRLLQERISKLLQCREKNGPGLPATCHVLGTLRLQDVATAPRVLTMALLSDVGQLEFPAVANDLGGDRAQVMSFLARDVAPVLFRAEGSPDTRPAKLVAARLQSEGETLIRAIIADAPKNKQLPLTVVCQPTGAPHQAAVSLAFAAAGTAACLSQDETAPATCPITQVVTRLFDTLCPADGPNPRDIQVRDAGVKLGLELLTATVGSSQVKTATLRLQLEAANDTVFDYLCLSVDFAAGCTVMEGETLAGPKNRLSALRGVLSAVIAEDKLEIVVRSASLLQSTLPGDDPRRGFRLLAGLLDYVATFDPAKQAAADGGGDAATALHEQRTKVLESLTRDMTDRTGRVGDAIFSLGGALRATAGAWVRKNGKDAFYGPLSLTLGFAYDIPLGKKPMGLHLEANALDLGRYLSWDEKGNVREVNVVEALAPSAGVSCYFGASLPFTIGATVTYSPRFQFSDSSSRGAVAVAASLGFYVPLLAFN